MFDVKPSPNTHRILIGAVDNARRVAMQFRYEMQTGTGVAYCFMKDKEYARCTSDSIFEVLNALENDILSIPVGTTDEIYGFKKNEDAETQTDE